MLFVVFISTFMSSSLALCRKVNTAAVWWTFSKRCETWRSQGH